MPTARRDGRRDADENVDYPYKGFMIREADTEEGENRLWYVSEMDRDAELSGPQESPAQCEAWIESELEP